MKVYAKSELHEGRMRHKMELGADALEVQILPERREPVPGMPVKVVHSVLQPDCVDLDKYANDAWTTLMLDDAYHIAEYYHAALIVHCGTNFDNISQKTLVNILQLMERHKDVPLLIENVVPVRAYEPQLVMCEGNFNPDSTPNLVRQLRELTGRDDIYSVLDTCHAEMTIRFMQTINTPSHPTVTLEDYFKVHEDTVGLFHFSRLVGNGYGKDHAQPFWDDYVDNQVMRQYLELYRRYGHNAPITLEVMEDDYDVSKGFEFSYKVLRKQERVVFKDGSIL